LSILFAKFSCQNKALQKSIPDTGGLSAPVSGYFSGQGQSAAVLTGGCKGAQTADVFKTKAAAILKKDAAAAFPQTKGHLPKIPGQRQIPLSRSPDLRIHSSRAAFSGTFPMTDFRQARRLHAHSGGTVPD